jgi:hypothetical protein
MSGEGVWGRLRTWWGRRSGRRLADVRIRIELHEDDPGWVFRVPSLNITGGAPTRREAVDRCIESIRFALEATGDRASEEPNQLYVDARLRPPRSPALV